MKIAERNKYPANHCDPSHTKEKRRTQDQRKFHSPFDITIPHFMEKSPTTPVVQQVERGVIFFYISIFFSREDAFIVNVCYFAFVRERKGKRKFFAVTFCHGRTDGGPGGLPCRHAVTAYG